MNRLPCSMPVSWWHVIVALENHGYTHAATGAAIGSTRSAVDNRKNRGAAPAWHLGECLAELWNTVTGSSREHVPRHLGFLAAAKVLQPALGYGSALSAA